MRKLLHLTTLIMLPLLAFSVQRSEHQHANEDVTFITNRKRVPDLAKQRAFRNSATWQAFVKKNGNWYAEFDELTGLPHRAFGPPVAVGNSSNMEALTRTFMQQELAGFGLPLQDMALVNIRYSGKFHYIDYDQTYQGLKILFSRLTFRVNAKNEVFMYGVDAFRQVNVNTIPTIDPKQAAAFAEGALKGDIQHSEISADLKILPIPGEVKYDFRLVYEIIVHTDEDHIPGAHYTLVDAHSGEILYRQNQTKFAGGGKKEVSMELVGDVYPQNPFQNLVTEPMPYAEVNINSTTYHTSINGEVSPGTSQTVNATAYLNGLYCDVRTGANGNNSPSITTSLNDGQNLVTFNNDATDEHRGGYFHTNKVHDYMKSRIPNYNGMDFPMVCRVSRTDGDCNAFYGGNSINFYETANGCYAYSLVADVVYHEYGHAINDNFYNDQGTYFANGALGEGYGDVWGMSIVESGVLGKGNQVNSPNSYVRRYDIQKKVYPDHIVGEVHADGEIIAGAWWRTAINLGDTQKMAMLFGEHYYGLPNGADGNEGQVFRDVLVEALVADDDDGDISNGTPNDEVIACSFAEHGIVMVPDMNETHVETVVYDPKKPVQLWLDMNSSAPWYIDEMHCFYRLSPNDPYQSQIMSFTNNNEFLIALNLPEPAQVLQYYFEFNNICPINGSVLNPDGSGRFPLDVDLAVPNIPYHTLIGYQMVLLEDFDNNVGNWTIGEAGDNANTGIWEIGSPNPSYPDPGNPTLESVVQTGADHSDGNGNQCAFTGNAPATDQFGSNDIDGGKTTLISPVFDLTPYNEPAIEFYRWYTNDQGASPKTDFWKVYVTGDGTNWVEVENTDVSDRQWRRFAFKVSHYITPTANVQIKFVAADDQPGSLVEAAVDDVAVWELSENPFNSVGTVTYDELQIFPNPARNFVAILPKAANGNYDIEFTDVLGKRVKQLMNVSTQMNKIVVPTHDLAPGTYMIRVSAGEKVWTDKLVITK